MALRTRAGEQGFALVAVLLAMALLTAIGAALTMVGVVDFRTSINHRSATQALLLADAGATHVLALMRGPLASRSYSEVLLGADGLAATEDDGLLVGFDLEGSDALPDTGVMLGQGRYLVRVVNDDADPSGDPYLDSNHRFIARCRGETRDGGVAEVRVMLAAPAFPAIAVNGALMLPGNPAVLGPCAGVHANGELTINGNPTVDGEVTYSEEVNLSGTVHDAAGNVVVPRYEWPVEVPNHDPVAFRDQADYILQDGWVVTVGPLRDSASATGQSVRGWRYSAAQNTYSLSGSKAEPGTYYVSGNAEVTGNAGKDGDPLRITIIATGSVKVTGTPRLTPDHPEGILILAGGDVEIGGNASGMTPNYSGLVYAGSQCQVHGNPSVGGHILCHDAPNPASSTDLVSENKVNGNPTVTYDCSGVRRRTLVSSWWESRTG
ncbi:MAG: hypothetical protein JSV41_13420 [Gemmatimonadota bacterium]|nr:MAG: hypothetical protein JSV41_13420 [Gemmatimonadota bacterium]